MEESDQKKLIEELLKLSESKDWAYAKLEWEDYHIFFKESKCLCGHKILENCVIKNKINGKRAVVGNNCVEKFIGLKLKGLFFRFKKNKKR